MPMFNTYANTTMAHHVRALPQEINTATATAPTPESTHQVGELVRASSTLLQDNASKEWRALSTFAGGERKIDIYLRNTRVIIDADMKAWRQKRDIFGNMTQKEIEDISEEAATAAEDCDQLRMETGKLIKTWVLHAVENLTTTDANDKHIRFRVAKYVNRQRATFEKYGFLMKRDARDNIDMRRCCILPTEDFIIKVKMNKMMRGVSNLTSQEAEQEEKRCNTGTIPKIPVPMATQDQLHLLETNRTHKDSWRDKYYAKLQDDEKLDDEELWQLCLEEDEDEDTDEEQDEDEDTDEEQDDDEQDDDNDQDEEQDDEEQDDEELWQEPMDVLTATSEATSPGPATDKPGEPVDQLFSAFQSATIDRSRETGNTVPYEATSSKYSPRLFNRSMLS